MIEKEKLIKWLEVEWVEPLHHEGEKLHKKVMNDDTFSDTIDYYKVIGSLNEIKAIIHDIKTGKLDAFNHKGCQKL